MYKEKRAPYAFSFRRTSPYYSRCDITPQSRGFIPNSYMQGLSPGEFFHCAMQARVDLLKKSFLISDSGDQSRIVIKNLELLIIDTMRFVAGQNQKIT